MADMYIEWEVDDGYCGGSRPQKIKIDIEELASSCETREEIESYIDDIVQEDFNIKVTSFVKNYDEVVAAVMDEIERQNDEDEEDEE